MSGAPRFGLTHEEATHMIDAVASCVRNHWEDELRAAGVTAAEREVLAPASVHEGFDFTSEPT